MTLAPTVIKMTKTMNIDVAIHININFITDIDTVIVTGNGTKVDTNICRVLQFVRPFNYLGDICRNFR